MKFQKKPVVIEAMQYTGNNHGEIMDWASGRATMVHGPHTFSVKTLEGVMTITPGDYVICGIKGEFYPCKPDIFTATYDPVKPDSDQPVYEPRSELGKLLRVLTREVNEFAPGAFEGIHVNGALMQADSAR